jgi:hypothetical protein
MSETRYLSGHTGGHGALMLQDNLNHQTLIAATVRHLPPYRNDIQR